MLASVSQLITVASVLAAASVAAQVPASASAAQLSIVDRQYVNSGLASNTNTGFGVPLTSTALLTVQYPGFVVSNGAAYTTNQTAPPAPIVYITPTNATLSTFTANRYVYDPCYRSVEPGLTNDGIQDVHLDVRRRQCDWTALCCRSLPTRTREQPDRYPWNGSQLDLRTVGRKRYYDLLGTCPSWYVPFFSSRYPETID